MKNKKIVVFLLIAIMVLGFTLTALVGCSGWKKQEVDVMFEDLVTIAENTIADRKLNNMELGASIVVDTTYGSSTRQFTIDLAAKLALNTADKNLNSASLTITDNTANKNVLSAYYDEAVDKDVFVTLGENGKFRIAGVKVKDVLAKNNATLDDKQSTAIGDTILDGLNNASDIIGMVNTLEVIDAKISKNKLTYRIETSIDKIFGGKAIGEILDMLGPNVQEVINNVGIDVQLAELNQILPSLVIGINVNVSEKKVENAKITGLSADLSCPKKDVVIKKTGEDAGNLLELVIKEDFKASVKADLFFNPETTRVKKPASYEGYTYIGLINIVANGSFTLDKDLDLKLDLGPISMSPKIKGGTYNLELAIHADAAALTDINFESHSTYKTFEILGEVLHKAVRYFKIDIKKAGESSSFLKIELDQQGNKNTLAIKSLEVGALGLPSSITSALTGSVDNVLSMVKGFVKDKVDDGYVYGDPDKDGKLTFKVDTANGYVDDGTGHVKYESNGLLAVADGYVPLNGKPAPKLGNGYIYDTDGKTLIVDVANGYSKHKKTGEIYYDSNGILKVEDGWTVYEGRPVKSDYYEEVIKPELNKKKEEADAKTMKTVADVLKSISVVIKDGTIDANLSDMAIKVGEDYFTIEGNNKVVKHDNKYYLESDTNYETEIEASKVKVEEKFIKLTGGLDVNKDGISINVNAKDLSKAMAGLPDDLTVTIKLTDIKYGTAPGNPK